MDCNDELYGRLCTKDTNGVWKSHLCKRFHMENLKPTCTLNGMHGEDNVRSEFTQHYKNVYRPNNTSLDAVYKNQVDIILDSFNSSSETLPFIDLDCFVSCVKQLKRNKAAGDDGITNEHIIFGTSDLYVHLCLLFNSLLRHCFVPAEFCFGIIIPLLKNKHGDVTSTDMYRGITLSSTVSKLFERVLLDVFGEYLQSDTLQYGFKKDVGCVDALFTFSESVRYFLSRGSRVFCVSMDANKAFDRVLQSGLLLKLLPKRCTCKIC